MNYGQVARDIRGRLHGLGVDVRPSSRFDVMLRLAEAISAPLDKDRIERSRFAALDLLQMKFILEQLFIAGPGSPQDRLLESLRRSLVDDVDPSKAISGSPGRNAQAELYVGAILAKAGLRPQKCDPPDWRFTHDGSVWSLEVKRIRSAAKLEARIREGFDRLAATRCTGVLALDISQLLRSLPTAIGRALPTHVGPQWSGRMQEYVEGSLPPHRLREWRGGSAIRAVLLMDHFVVPDDQGALCTNSMLFGVTPDMDNESRRREFDRVFAAIEAGTATPANAP